MILIEGEIAMILMGRLRGFTKNFEEIGAKLNDY